MEVIKRKVTIHWKYSPSTFEKINKRVLGSNVKKIGASRPAVNSILEQYEMLKVLMPSILGINPESRDTDWDKHIAYYWNSLSLDVPSSGKTLEVGLRFDIRDKKRKEYIDELSKKVATKANAEPFKTNKDLATYVMGYNNDIPNVDEDERWKYGTPISIEDYLVWRYIQNYRDVADKFEDINKSPKIRFYLHTQEDEDRAKAEENKLRNKAMTEFTKFITESTEEDFNNVISIIYPEQIKSLVETKDKPGKQRQLMDIMYKQPYDFLNAIGN